MEQQPQQQPASSTASAEPAGVEYVGFWSRVGAMLIDSVVALLVLGIIGRILGLDEIEFNGDLNVLLANPQFARGQLIQHLILAALVVVCWLRFASTPGKRVIGAEVVDAKTLAPMSAGQAVVRYLSYYVSMLGCFLGFLWIAVDTRKQGWHDKIAGTVVIRKR